MKSSRIKVMAVFLVATSLSIASSEEQPKNVNVTYPKINSTNITSKPPDEPPSTAIEGRTDASSSIMSRIANWWPFGDSNIKLSDRVVDNVVAEDYQQSGQYLPAPSGHGHQETKPHRAFCHPCNHEPWIPVAANYGHNTIIGFMPPSDYGGKPPSPQYEPPSQQYGPPIHQYGPPIGISNEYGPPPSISGHGLPSLIHVDSSLGFGHSGPGPIYGPPKPIFLPPKPQIKPHFIPKLPKGHYGQPKPNYGPPPKPQYGPPLKPQYGPPKLLYGPPQGKPNLNAYLSPPSANFGVPKFKPKFIQAPKNNYGPPPLDLFGPQKYGPPKPFISPPQQNYGPPNQQYGVPLTLEVQPSIEILSGHLGGHAQSIVTDPEYLPPKEHQELPLSNGPDDFLNQPLPPIPLPNLSFAPMAPIYEPQPFRQQHIGNNHFASQLHDSSYDNSQSVEIQQSLPLADYIASIDHPINVIQSPITDLNVQANLEPQNYEDSYDFQGEDNSGQYSYNANVRLSEHPIVVADINAPAASTNNETVVHANPNAKQDNKKRGNDNDLSVTFFHQDLPKVTPQFINHQIALQESSQQDINDNFIGVNNKPSQFLLPTRGYTSWNLEYDTISTSSMVPPPKTAPNWLTTVATARPLEVTKKPKQIQIIIPYTTKNKALSYGGLSKLPLRTQPPKTESVWAEHAKDSVKLSSENTERLMPFTHTPPTTSGIINIKELLNDGPTKQASSYGNLPFDIVRLQKNIDGWTEQEYANTMKFAQKHAVTSRYVTAKKIPDNFFTTAPYEDDNEVTTVKYNPNNQFFDHEPAGSNINDEIENNFIITEAPTTANTDDYYDSSTDFTSARPQQKESWEKLQVSVSPITKEKIYVVTPQSTVNAKSRPKDNEIAANVSYATDKFAVKINSEERSSNSSGEEFEGDVKVVLSEWPHIINNLETTSSTTTSTTSSRPTVNSTALPSPSSGVYVTSPPRRHPLFGLIDLTAFTARPPHDGATIQTYSGHSKVASSSSSGTTRLNVNPTSTTATTKPTLKS